MITRTTFLIALCVPVFSAEHIAGIGWDSGVGLHCDFGAIIGDAFGPRWGENDKGLMTYGTLGAEGQRLIIGYGKGGHGTSAIHKSTVGIGVMHHNEDGFMYGGEAAFTVFAVGFKMSAFFGDGEESMSVGTVIRF